MMVDEENDFNKLSAQGAHSFQAGNYALANSFFERALAIKPDDAHILNNAACSLLRLGKGQESISYFEKALSLLPTDVSALSNFGAALCDSFRFTDAIQVLQKALLLDTENVAVLGNLGRAFMSRAEDDKALHYFDRALLLNPNHSESRYNRGSIYLSRGDYIRGFLGHLARWEEASLMKLSRLQTRAPLWTGQESLNGKTILLQAEQGLGDTLQFARFAPILARRNCRIILRAPSALSTVLKTLPGNINILLETSSLPEHDYYCPLLNLPSALGITVDSVPSELPYLRADPKRTVDFEVLLGKRNAPRIGIVWAGRQYHPINVKRDMSLDILMPLFSLGASFFSLQKEIPTADVELFKKLDNVRDMGDFLNDYSDTAALIAALDLIISVDTSVAHMAGALGKPVWIMNRQISCWRWLRGNSKSPWYPNARIFNQESSDDWGAVVAEVRSALIKQGVEMPEMAPLTPENSELDNSVASFGVDYVEGLVQGAKAFVDKGLISDAVSYLDDVLILDPTRIDALKIQVTALLKRGALDRALSVANQAAEIAPADPEVSIARAAVLHKLNRPQEALQELDKNCFGDASHEQDRRLRFALLRTLSRQTEALTVITDLLKRAPNDLELLNSRGLILEELQQYEDALQDFERMRSINESHFDALNNSGLALARMGRFSEALARFEQALAVRPGSMQPLYNRSIMRLVLGDLPNGFRDFESRWKVDPLKNLQHPTPAPLWVGRESLVGRSILVYHEQGYGDTLQFVRYVPKLSELGARVILAVPPALVDLMRTLPGEASIVTDGDSMPFHEFRCPLMTLPLAFGTTLDTVPATMSYLSAATPKINKWSRTLGHHRRCRIGIAWAGRRYAPINGPRDMTLADIKPLLDLDVDFISLQKEIPEIDAASPLLARLSRHGETLTDFSDTAALIANLDLVVTVDTSIAHLAGALGKPVWIFNRYATCWRWLCEIDHSPWYPTARLFRQESVGDWTGAVRKLKTAVVSALKKSGPSNFDVISNKKRPMQKNKKNGKKQSIETKAPASVEKTLRPKIKFVCATRFSSQEFFVRSGLGRSLMHFREFPRGQQIEARLFPNNNLGLSTVYNIAIEESISDPSILIFAHDDIILTDFYWVTHLLESLEQFSVVGVSGNKRRVPKQPSWMYLDETFKCDSFENFSGVVGHGENIPNLRQMSVYGPPLQEVKLLDGVFLAVGSQLLIDENLRFDEQFKFHFYDLDFCRQAELRNIKMGTCAVSIVHQSIGRLATDEWKASYQLYLKKYLE